jgi:DNA-binding transcriptional regulator LsrR (DeoR family)
MAYDRLDRLEEVARLYYEQDMTQAEIARRIGVSRPFVSKLLTAAKQAGVVEINIRSRIPKSAVILNSAREVFGIQGGILVPGQSDDSATNLAIGRGALELVDELGGGRLGLSWGQVVGAMVADLEGEPPVRSKITHVAPLIGNRGVPVRHYHSNENTRILAQQRMATAHFLHAPSIAETQRELELLRQTEHYQSVQAFWDRLDIAVVNIGNHPSTPDFASGARFGTLLAKHRAVGHLIAYFYDRAGQIIVSDHDYAIQIPVETLAKVPKVVGVCAATVGPEALIGALNTGLVTHIVASDSVVSLALRTLADQAHT